MSSASSATASPVCDFESVQFSEQDTQQAPAAAALPATGATGAGLGQKALLAKKMAKNINRATVSPTDNMMTPCTAKLTQAKKKHFNKGGAIKAPLFGTPSALDEDDADADALAEREDA